MYFTTHIAFNISFVWFNTITFYTWDASLQYIISCFPIMLLSFSFNLTKECSKHFFNNSAASKIVTTSLLSIVLLVLIPNLQHDQYEMEITFSATNFSSYIIELLQLQDAIQIQWSYAWIHNIAAKRSHLMI